MIWIRVVGGQTWKAGTNVPFAGVGDSLVRLANLGERDEATLRKATLALVQLVLRRI